MQFQSILTGAVGILAALAMTTTMASAKPKPKPLQPTTIEASYGAGVQVVNVGKAKGDRTKAVSESTKLVAGAAIVGVDSDGNVEGVSTAMSAGMTTGMSVANSSGPCKSEAKTSESGSVGGGATASITVTQSGGGEGGHDGHDD